MIDPFTRQSRRRILSELVKQRGKESTDIDVRRRVRWLVVAKALFIVALLPRRPIETVRDDCAMLVFWGGGSYQSQDGTFYDWWYAAVRLGWRRWSWDYGTDST